VIAGHLEKQPISNEQRQKWRRRIAVAVIAPAVWSAFAWGAAKLLIVDRPLARADAIALLSGAATFKERARRSAALYHAGRAAGIILTNDNQQGGWSAKEQRNPYYYQRAQAELLISGVPQQNIQVLASPVSGTDEEAILVRRHAEKNGLHYILVVTSSYHSRRALWTFGRVFQGSATQIGLEAVEPGLDTPSPGTWWFHVRGWEMVPTEYLKMALYWWRLRRLPPG